MRSCGACRRWMDSPGSAGQSGFVEISPKQRRET
jgi:hypothetical protein